MLAKTQRRILAIGAAHHRLAWILPFMDGNGRVMRLFSHLLLKKLGMRSELWSVSRGLALHVERYKALLQAADEPRRGPLDGRGSLSESGLAVFCHFLLGCLHRADQLHDNAARSGRVRKGRRTLVSSTLSPLTITTEDPRGTALTFAPHEPIGIHLLMNICRSAMMPLSSRHRRPPHPRRSRRSRALDRRPRCAARPDPRQCCRIPWASLRRAAAG